MKLFPLLYKSFHAEAWGILQTRDYQFHLDLIRPGLKQQYLLTASNLNPRQLTLDTVHLSTKILFTICLKNFGQNS